VPWNWAEFVTERLCALSVIGTMSSFVSGTVSFVVEPVEHGAVADGRVA